MRKERTVPKAAARLDQADGLLQYDQGVVSRSADFALRKIMVSFQ
jgi:hypothetical protein